VLVPVVVHLPGNNGTQWRSDVWVANVGSNAGNVTLTYHPQDGGPLSITLPVDSYGGIYLHDIVLESFGLSDSKGYLTVVTEETTVEVRARVYNAGNPAGEFGQAVPGIPVGRLNSGAYLSGVGTAGDTRLNLGFVNPTDDSTTVNVDFCDGETGEPINVVSFTVTVGPHELVQVDRVAERWDLPARDAVIIWTYTYRTPIYGYASMVRNDTGDAIFVFGTTPNSGPDRSAPGGR
jgi:hypothetical protein